MPIIRLRDLHKTFYIGARAIEVLKGIDLDIESGETVAVLGASGVGKSTLLHVIGTLEHPSRGNVLIEDRDPYRMSEKEIAGFRNRTIGFVFQFHHLLPEFSALENVMMPGLIAGMRRREAQARAEALLDELHLKDRAGHRPGTLSGGEAQRVAVARALVLSPKILLADEPTGNLDRKTGEEIEELLRGLNRERGITVVIVTHNEGLAEGMSCRLRMVDGRFNN